MKIRVRVHTRARLTRTEQRDDELHVWVKTPPVDGKANLQVAEILAKLHGVPTSSVRLASGRASKAKVFELDGL